MAYIGLVQAQVTAIPDPIFEQFLIDHGMDTDGIINGQVLTSDIDYITTMIINESPPFYFVNDFTGIQDFVSLEWFVFVGATVVEMDLGNLTNLKHIEGLSIINLAYIDVSGSEGLENFSMGGTSLSTILLPQSQSLLSFACGSCLLTELDLSYYVNLTYIMVERNSLEYLNVANGNNTNVTTFIATQNPDLNCIIVDDTAYSEANWTFIDPASTFVESEAECDALTTNESSFEDFKIYPNPASDFFQLKVINEFERIDVIDLTGKVVKSFTESSYKYQVTELSKGLYILSIHTNYGKSFQKLVIK